MTSVDGDAFPLGPFGRRGMVPSWASYASPQEREEAAPELRLHGTGRRIDHGVPFVPGRSRRRPIGHGPSAGMPSPRILRRQVVSLGELAEAFMDAALEVCADSEEAKVAAALSLYEFLRALRRREES